MTQFKERGIIFTAWSIPKIIDRTKTQTRRTYGLEFVNQDPDAFEFLRMEGDLAVFHKLRNSYRNAGEIPFTPIASFPKKRAGVAPNALFYIKCPYGQVGDRLWVKETFFIDECRGDDIYGHHGPVVFYRATDFSLAEKDDNSVKWRPSIHMPRLASRIYSEITNLRAERLQDITDKDAEAEGFKYHIDEFQPGCSYIVTAREKFEDKWDSLNPRYPWVGNHWLWVIGFKLLP